MTVYGIVGLLKLNVGDYVIVVTDRSRVGRINGHDIYRLKKYDILRIPVSDGHLSEDQVRWLLCFESFCTRVPEANTYGWSNIRKSMTSATSPSFALFSIRRVLTFLTLSI